MSHRLAALGIVAAMALAACGGDDGDPVAASDDTAAVDPGDDASNDASADDFDDADDASGDGSDADDTADEATDDEVVAAGVLVPGDPVTGKPAVQLPAELPIDLVITDVVEGDGAEVEVGDTVTTHYVGVLTADGTEFDNSYDFGQPITLVAGTGQVIPGFDQGLLGARVGGLRQIDIPPALGYGDAGAGGVIPPGATLTFVIEILEVSKPAPPPTIGPRADASECPPTDGSGDRRQEFEAYPPTCIDVTETYTVEITTNFGTIVADLDPVRAPLTVNSFVTLARYRYFDDTECHRAIPGFVVQCGDPTATGTGGPGYRIPDELPEAGEYAVGSLAMANAGPNTSGSQFFIITGAQGAALPPSYSLFGEVVEGLDVLAELDAVANPADNGVPPLEQILIESVRVVAGS